MAHGVARVSWTQCVRPHLAGERRTGGVVPFGHGLRGQSGGGQAHHPLSVWRRLGEPFEAGAFVRLRGNPGVAQAGHPCGRLPLQRGARRVHGSGASLRVCGE